MLSPQMLQQIHISAPAAAYLQLLRELFEELLTMSVETNRSLCRPSPSGDTNHAADLWPPLGFFCTAVLCLVEFVSLWETCVSLELIQAGCLFHRQETPGVYKVQIIACLSGKVPKECRCASCIVLFSWELSFFYYSPFFNQVLHQLVLLAAMCCLLTRRQSSYFSWTSFKNTTRSVSGTQLHVMTWPLTILQGGSHRPTESGAIGHVWKLHRGTWKSFLQLDVSALLRLQTFTID